MRVERRHEAKVPCVPVPARARGVDRPGQLLRDLYPAPPPRQRPDAGPGRLRSV